MAIEKLLHAEESNALFVCHPERSTAGMTAH
jgi:hypothetical protein